MDEHNIVSVWSKDGATKWSSPQVNTVNEETLLKTFAAAYESKDPRERGWYYAGYEGPRFSRACPRHRLA